LFLVSDLKRPDRVLYLFLRPQWRSWLAIGAQIINLAALVALAFLVASIAGAGDVRDALRWAMVPAGIALAGYTAFLFNQCEGRDLWQSPLLLPHTIINAILAGAGALGIAGLFASAPTADGRALGWSVLLSASFGLAIIALDTFGTHPTRQAERAARNLWRDLYARRFWSGLLLAGVAAPILAAGFLMGGGAVLLAVAGVAALVGLWLYEDAWVRAGQSVPLS
jgi:formate-dependent nitrite reductase membrane component NrfD